MEKICRNCKYWEAETFGGYEFDFGVCNKIDINVRLDRKKDCECVVDSITTNEAFYCANFKYKDEKKVQG